MASPNPLHELDLSTLRLSEASPESLVRWEGVVRESKAWCVAQASALLEPQGQPVAFRGVTRKRLKQRLSDADRSFLRPRVERLRELEEVLQSSKAKREDRIFEARTEAKQLRKELYDWLCQNAAVYDALVVPTFGELHARVEEVHEANRALAELWSRIHAMAAPAIAKGNAPKGRLPPTPAGVLTWLRSEHRNRSSKSLTRLLGVDERSVQALEMEAQSIGRPLKNLSRRIGAGWGFVERLVRWVDQAAQLEEMVQAERSLRTATLSEPSMIPVAALAAASEAAGFAEAIDQLPPHAPNEDASQAGESWDATPAAPSRPLGEAPTAYQEDDAAPGNSGEGSEAATHALTALAVWSARPANTTSPELDLSSYSKPEPTRMRRTPFRYATVQAARWTTDERASQIGLLGERLVFSLELARWKRAYHQRPQAIGTLLRQLVARYWAGIEEEQIVAALADLGGSAESMEPGPLRGILWPAQTPLGDRMGFDLFGIEDSFEQWRCVEVKTTEGRMSRPFEVTINEYRTAAREGERYVIARVSNVQRHPPEVRYLRDPLRLAADGILALAPTRFSVSIGAPGLTHEETKDTYDANAS